MEFRVFLDSRLPEYRTFYRVDSGGKPIDDHVNRMLVQAAGVDIRRKSMVIGNEMKIVKCSFPVGRIPLNILFLAVNDFEKTPSASPSS
jgi:hypothetical protein